MEEFIIENNILQEYTGTSVNIEIPKGIAEIASNAFKEYGRYNLKMSIKCPKWTTKGAAKRYGFAESIINRADSTITFTDENENDIAKIVLATADETEPKTNAFILSIRCADDGEFDFAGYDSNFSALSKVSNKIKMALTRLQYPYALSEDMQDAYRGCLKRNGAAAGILLMNDNDKKGFHFCLEKKFFNAAAVKKLMEYASEGQKTEFMAWLLEYEHTVFGKSKLQDKDTLLSLEAEIDAKPQEKKMTAADYRKIFKFKYKDGGIIITGYIGEEECVTLPEKIGNKYVIGLGRGAFGYGTSKKVKKIIVPGWITFYEGGVFRILKNTEVEIQEGVTTLPRDTFFVVNNLTIKMPASLVNIEDQFGDSEEQTIHMLVPKASHAEAFCKEHGYNYTVYEADTVSADNVILTNQEKASAQRKSQTAKNAVTPWKKPKAGSHLIPRYMGQDTQVTFPTEIDGISVTGIANTAGDTPDNYRAITSITIPEGYTYIGNKAFCGCENLETISLPSTLTEIGTQAFADCKKLKEVIIGKNVRFIGKNTFSGSNIRLVIMELKSNEYIPSQLFYGCHIERLVVCGGAFKSRGNVFAYTGIVIGQSNRYEENFPDQVYTDYNFSTLDLKGNGGKNAKRIHPIAEFDENTVLDDMAKKWIRIEKNKKGSAVNHTEQIVIPQNVESINFADSIFVLSLDSEDEWDVRAEIEQRGGIIKDTVSARMRYLIIPDREITKNYKVKKAIEFQEKGKTISLITLSECRRHMHIHDEKIFGKEGAKIAANYRLAIENDGIVLKRYVGSEEHIKIPEMIGEYPVLALEKDCFAEVYNYAHKPKIKSIEIPSCIQSLPQNVFRYCSDLSSIMLSEGLITIQEGAFRECRALRDLTIPSTVTRIGKDAFSHCKNLQRLIIPANVTDIEGSFIGCNNLQEIIVDEKNVRYDSRNNCNAVIETETNTIVASCRSTVIPPTVSSIGDSAFSGMDYLDSFRVPEGITEIGNGAFSGCVNLKSVEIPASVIHIGYSAFSWCGLTRIKLPEKLVEFHVSVFSNCTQLTELVVNDQLREIQDIDKAWMYNWPFKTIYGSKKSIARSIAEARHCTYIEI